MGDRGSRARRGLELYEDAEATARTGKEVNIFTMRSPAAVSCGGDHSSQSLAFDAAGRLRLFIKHESSAELVACVLRCLIERKRR